MKQNFCGRHAVLEGDVQPLERDKLDPYRPKLSLLRRHILDVSELVIPTEVVGNVSIQRKVLSPINWGDIRLQYIMV